MVIDRAARRPGGEHASAREGRRGAEVTCTPSHHLSPSILVVSFSSSLLFPFSLFFCFGGGGVWGEGPFFHPFPLFVIAKSVETRQPVASDPIQLLHSYTGYQGSSVLKRKTQNATPGIMNRQTTTPGSPPLVGSMIISVRQIIGIKAQACQILDVSAGSPSPSPNPPSPKSPILGLHSRLSLLARCRRSRRLRSVKCGATVAVSVGTRIVFVGDLRTSERWSATRIRREVYT